MNGRCGLHQIPSTFGHLVDRRTSRRAVTHTAGRSALPAWARARRRAAAASALSTATERQAEDRPPASHAAAELGCGPSRGQLVRSSDALAAGQFRRVGRAAAVSRAAVRSRRIRRWLLGGERRLGAAPRGVGSDGHASASVHWVGHRTRASGPPPQTTWNRPELGETAASRGAVCFAIIV